MATLQPVANLARLVWPRTLHPTRSDREAITSIREQASQYRALTDTALGEQTDVLRDAVRGGSQSSEEQIVTTGFALVSEAARRTIGIEYYDVQLLAGLALSRRTAAEMQTGEGKTFVAALPAYHLCLGVPRRARHDVQRLFGRAQLRIAGTLVWHAWHDRGGFETANRTRSEGSRLRVRCHLRTGIRIRVRLPARSSRLVGSAPVGAGRTTPQVNAWRRNTGSQFYPAGSCVCDCRRNRLRVAGRSDLPLDSLSRSSRSGS